MSNPMAITNELLHSVLAIVADNMKSTEILLRWYMVSREVYHSDYTLARNNIIAGRMWLDYVHDELFEVENEAARLLDEEAMARRENIEASHAAVQMFDYDTD